MTVLEPRNAENLSHSQLWDETFVKSRLSELTMAFMTELELSEMKRVIDDEWIKAIAEKRRPKPDVWKPPTSEQERRDKYFAKASELAHSVLEEERRNYVAYISERWVKRTLENLKRKLGFLVYNLKDGKLAKAKITVEHSVLRNHKGDSYEADVQHIDGDFERLAFINALRGKVAELTPYAPYFPEDVKGLYDEVVKLATLEIIEKKPKPEVKPKT